MARIPGFHPGGPGSIPGMGSCFRVCSVLALFLKAAAMCDDETRDLDIFKFSLIIYIHSETAEYIGKRQSLHILYHINQAGK